MSLVVPNVGEEAMIGLILNQTLTLKLFSNNIVPGEADTAASYTEVAGGGYASKSLLAGGWTITPGAPSFGIYAPQTFNFTGVTNAPGTVYGYYVVDAANVLMWAEAFGITYTPAADGEVGITPRFELS